MYLPEDFIQAIREQTDLVELIRAYVPSLKKAGMYYKAPCPFHQEKTPSFMVHPQKQYYHCFGCGAHGDAIRFLQEHLGVSFMEAIRFLADQNGLIMPEMQKEKAIDSDPNAVPYADHVAFLKMVSRFYRQQLKNSPEAIAYLKSREMTGQTAYFFEIGYVPNGWQNLTAVLSPPQEYVQHEKILLQTGLIIKNDTGKLYDRFRDRIMFPIHNMRGEIIAFGGRIFQTSQKNEPKYLNSPETALFVKSKILYGLYLQQKEIRKAQRVLVVEGYLDVIMLHQAGIHYSVATLGTATTAEHIKVLLKVTDRIIFCFDGDAAGEKAAWRALENSLEALVDGCILEFLFLPKGEDPDSFVRTVGKEGFEQYLYNTLSLSQFLVNKIQEDLKLEIGEERIRLLHRAAPLLKKIALKKARGISLLLRQTVAKLGQVSLIELETLLQLEPQAQNEQNLSFQQFSNTPVIQKTGIDHQFQILLLRFFGLLYHFPQFLFLLAETECTALLNFLKKQTQPSHYGLLLTLIAFIQENPTQPNLEQLHSFFDQHPVYQNMVRKIQNKIDAYLELWRTFPIEKLQQEFHHTVLAFGQFIKKQEQIKIIQQQLSV